MIGFVVRSRNEEQHVGFALQSIFDFFGEKTYVVVVDNESTDNTLHVVKSFPKKFFNIQITTIKNQTYTPGLALNTGLSLLKDAGCEFGGILSSHCEITKMNIDFLLNHFSDPSCFGVMGKQIPIRMGKRITPRYIWSNFQHQNVMSNIKESTLLDEDRYFFHNAFSFIRIDSWNKIKFNENLAGKEDRFWAKDLIELGGNFIFDPRIECKHYWTDKGATWRD